MLTCREVQDKAARTVFFFFLPFEHQHTSECWTRADRARLFPSRVMSSVVVRLPRSGRLGTLEIWKTGVSGYSGILDCWRPEYWDTVNINTGMLGDDTGIGY